MFKYYVLSDCLKGFCKIFSYSDKIKFYSGLYFNPRTYLLQDTNYGNINIAHAPKRRNFSSINNIHLCHSKLGHINKNKIQN